MGNFHLQKTEVGFFMFKKKNDAILFKVKQEFDFEILAEEFILIREAEVSKYTVGIGGLTKGYRTFIESVSPL